MSYSVGEHFEQFIRTQVGAGRYNNASELVREGLRLVEEKELKLNALREHLKHAVKKGGAYSDDDLATLLAAE